MLKIIYDATIISCNFYKDDNRSGIFFVGLNILEELRKRTDVELFLYVDPEKSADAIRLQAEYYPNENWFQDFSKNKFLSGIYSKVQLFYNAILCHQMLRKPVALMLFFLQFLLKRNVKTDVERIKDADAFLSPVFKVPDIIRKYPSIRPYVFLHDAIPVKFPQFFPYGKSFVVKIMESSRQGDRFFAVSQNTKKDFEEFFPEVVREENTMVVPLAVNERFDVVKDENTIKKIKSKYRIPENKKYVFSLCTVEPRKNLIRAVRAFLNFVEKNKIEDLVWVMGGAVWVSFAKELARQGVNWNKNQILHVGYVDDEDLPALYSNAEWFVYTSQYEGFGIPPLEAMRCGCPVITSNNSSLSEVVGDAGIKIDWDSDEQHVAAYEKYYYNKELRNEKISSGLEFAKKFSWEKTVSQIVACVSENAIK
ncbi:glycosyltransferase family 1 protein [uncultured Fibrobacter sp.]|uniref:glycosyltransferase family 4 protein n=1 Tax=uncultured Fibrobacter sp. TaxID=261512 RepID=UPI0025FC0A10|nr:glycosyltransferase family 1 protein [uncultured Fibrobacter sp.]